MQYCFVKNTSKTEIQLFDTVQWSTQFDTKIIVMNAVFLRLKNLGVILTLWGWIRGHFQILGVISYIMYIEVTFDVNKNATFWGFFFDHRNWYMY